MRPILTASLLLATVAPVHAVLQVEAARATDAARARNAAYAAQLAQPTSPVLPGLASAPQLDVSAAQRSAVGLNALDGGLAGAGPGYFVRLDEDGLRMQPAASPDSADAFAFRLEAVERNGDTLAIDAAPRFRDLGILAVAHHGDALEERYEMRPAGVEQSFLLHELPGGSSAFGDLVIRGRVQGALQAASGAHARGLAFARDGQPRFGVGAVLAIDADGRTADGSLRWDGEHLELVVPGDFVAGARLPLLVDPLIQVEWVVASNATDIDVAYDADTDLWIAVWRLAEGGPTLFAQRYDSLGIAVGSLIIVAGPGEQAAAPSIGNLNAGDLFPVAYNAHVPGGGIRVRSIEAATGAVSEHVTLPLTSPAYGIHPQVGGDPIAPYDQALIVWQDANPVTFGFEGLAQLVQCTPGAKPAFTGAKVKTGVGTFGGLGLSNLRVTKSNGPTGVWLVTNDRIPEFLFPAQIDVQALDFNGQLCGSITIGGVSGGYSQAAPAGDGQSFLVVYRRDSLASEDIRAQCLLLEGCDLTLAGPDASLLDDIVQKHHKPDVVLVDGGYLAAWVRDDAKVESVRINAGTCQPCGPNTIVSLDAPFIGEPGPVRMASRYASSFAVADDQALIAWSDAGNDVHAAFAKAVLDGSVVDLGGGCDDGPDFSHLGDPMLGSDLDLILSAIPDSVFSAGLMVAPSETLFDLGGCGALLPSFTIPFAVDPPLLTLKVPLPCDGDFVGVTWRFQYVVVGIPGEPVPGLPGITLSNALEFTFGG